MLLQRWVNAIRSHLLLSGIIVVLVALVLAGVVVQPWSAQDTSAQYTAENLESGAVKGFLHRPVDRPAAPFTLTDQNDRTVSLEDFRGKWLVVYWLYTNCLDTCPALTYNMKILQQGLGDRVGKQVQLVTITFDWEHDTVDRMKSYAGQVKGDIPGWSWLTGTKEQTDAVAEAYGVAFAPLEQGKGGSLTRVDFDHTALTVVIDPQGIERHRYFGVGWSQDLLERLDRELAGSDTNGPTSLQGSAVKDDSARLPLESADLQELLAKSSIFPFEEWELEEGIFSETLYQFPTYTLALTYNRRLLDQSQSRGWINEGDIEGHSQWMLLSNGGTWAAIGSSADYALVFVMEGESRQAVLKALDTIDANYGCGG